MPFAATITQYADRITIRPIGELGLTVRSDLRRLCEDSAEMDESQLYVDLSDVTSLDLGSIRILEALASDVLEAGGRAVFVCPHDQLRAMLAGYGLRPAIRVVKSDRAELVSAR